MPPAEPIERPTPCTDSGNSARMAERHDAGGRRRPCSFPHELQETRSCSRRREDGVDVFGLQTRSRTWRERIARETGTLPSNRRFGGGPRHALVPVFKSFGSGRKIAVKRLKRAHAAAFDAHRGACARVDAFPGVALVVDLRGACTCGAGAGCAIVLAGHGDAIALFSGSGGAPVEATKLRPKWPWPLRLREPKRQ
jgi:hypothetical protein